MRLAVFGANGRTGRKVVEKALEEGMDVAAFDIDFTSFPFEQPERIQGDVKELEDVKEAVEGVDACISTLGVTENTPPYVVSAGVSNIMDAMEEEGVSRIVILTGAGAKLPSEKKTFNDRLLNLAASLAMPGAVEDGKRMVREVSESDLDWTVVRAPRLTDRGSSGSHTVSDRSPTVLDSISRADVAEYMVEAVKRDLEVREMPFIS